MTQLTLPNGIKHDVESKHVRIYICNSTSDAPDYKSKGMNVKGLEGGITLITFPEADYGNGWLDYYIWGEQKLSGSATTASLFCQKNGDLTDLPVPYEDFRSLLDELGMAY